MLDPFVCVLVPFRFIVVIIPAHEHVQFSQAEGQQRDGGHHLLHTPVLEREQDAGRSLHPCVEEHVEGVHGRAKFAFAIKIHG